MVYDKQLKAAGVKTFDAFLALDSDELTKLAEQFRGNWPFFPAMKAILNELAVVMDQSEPPNSIVASVWRCAGILGVQPWGFTFFELANMTHEAMILRWDHTAAITAMIANVNRPKGKAR